MPVYLTGGRVDLKIAFYCLSLMPCCLWWMWLTLVTFCGRKYLLPHTIFLDLFEMSELKYCLFKKEFYEVLQKCLCSLCITQVIIVYHKVFQEYIPIWGGEGVYIFDIDVESTLLKSLLRAASDLDCLISGGHISS